MDFELGILIMLLAFVLVWATFILLEPPQVQVVRECNASCNTLNSTMFQAEFESGGLAASTRDCYCEKDGEVQQVW